MVGISFRGRTKEKFSHARVKKIPDYICYELQLFKTFIESSVNIVNISGIKELWHPTPCCCQWLTFTHILQYCPFRIQCTLSRASPENKIKIIRQMIVTIILSNFGSFPQFVNILPVELNWAANRGILVKQKTSYTTCQTNELPTLCNFGSFPSFVNILPVELNWAAIRGIQVCYKYLYLILSFI